MNSSHVTSSPCDEFTVTRLTEVQPEGTTIIYAIMAATQNNTIEYTMHIEKLCLTEVQFIFKTVKNLLGTNAHHLEYSLER